MNLQEIENSIVDLCREVGDFIQTESKNFDKEKIELKGEGFNNLVSYVDKESEKKIVAALNKILPRSGILGEEGASVDGTNDYRWIIDPLDGTTNFTHGLPIFSISIGLLKHNEIVAGVVHDITRGDAYHTSKGNPSYCNNQEIHVSKARNLNESLLATGFPYYHFDKRDAYLEIIKTFLEKTHGIRRLGSAAIDLAYVACGRMEGFFEYNLNAWDVAAGALLVKQAGGIVTDFSGGDNFLFGGELCAGCEVHSQMLAVINSNWK
jgi:myo-inositol-1(or 4)-monophosphatase